MRAQPGEQAQVDWANCGALRFGNTWRKLSVFVMVLGMCYRYIYLFVEILENTHRAVQSRVGSRLHFRKGQRLVTWHIASLWTRSHQLNEQVYNAMVSRGFRGEPVALTRSGIHHEVTKSTKSTKIF